MYDNELFIAMKIHVRFKLKKHGAHTHALVIVVCAPRLLF